MIFIYHCIVSGYFTCTLKHDKINIRAPPMLNLGWHPLENLSWLFLSLSVPITNFQPNFLEQVSVPNFSNIFITIFSCKVVSKSLWSHGLQHARHVLHSLQEFAQIHVLWVIDVIQTSHPISSSSPPVLDLSQHQGLYQWGCSSHQVAKVLQLQLQHQSFQWIFRVDFL